MSDPKWVAVEGRDIPDPAVGSHVVYVDPRGVEHDALLTNVFPGHPAGYYELEGGTKQHTPESPANVNVVYVCKDERRTDSAGQQIVRQYSVGHRSVQNAHGNYWQYVS